MSKLLIEILHLCYRKSEQIVSFSRLLSLIQCFNIFRFTNNGDDRLAKYWRSASVDEIIFEADVLYKNGKYLEVYEILNKLKYSNNVEVQWRIARALFKLCNFKFISEEIKRQMILEAYEIIMATLPAGDNNTKVHKWAAIISDRKSGLEGIEKRLKNFPSVKMHLIKCCELSPDEVTSYYLLGKWCYEICNLSWFQRILSKLLFGNPPDSTYEEAYEYFSKVEAMCPRIYLVNTYLLGKTCMRMGQYYSAKYYLGLTAKLQPHNEYERQCVRDAKKVMKRLNRYSLEKDVLFYEYPLGANE